MDSLENKKSTLTEESGTRAAEAAKDFFPNFSTVYAVLEGAQIGIWCWDVAADKVTWSKNFEAIHRLRPGSLDGSYAGFVREIHGDDRPNVEAAVKEALHTLGKYRVRYRLSASQASEDRSEERWVESNGAVTVKDGRPAQVIGICNDVTERVDLEAELRSRIKQQEALAQLGERALSERDLERLLNDAVSTVAVTLSADFVDILELLPGNADLLLRAGFGWGSELVGSIASSTAPDSHARFTLDSPLPVVTENFAAETRFRVDPYVHEQRCVSGITATIAGRDDRHYGILGVCTKSPRRFSAAEIAFLAAIANLLAGAIARRQLQQRHELMIRDMRHRSGNLFSQLLALFSQTAKNSKSIADLSSKYRARVLALANAQRLITESGGQSTPLMDLLYVLLGPYLDRISFNGPDVELEPDPVFNLSAALHELADNAVKHGSLSRPKGRLELTWSVSQTQRGMTLTLDWEEKNGGPPRRPKRSGFGTRLITLVIERQLNGEITRSFARKGLSVHMVVPLTHERWPSASTAGAASSAPVTSA